MKQTFRIAAVQAASVFLDLDASVSKACRLIEEAASAGAELIVFPEAFLPGYPLWVWFIPPGKTHPLRALYTRLHANSISIPGPEVSRLARTAGELGVAVAIGVNEKNTEASNSTLYNTLLYLGPNGEVMGKHRKMIPTAGERLVWGQAAGCDLDVFTLPFARISGLLCWENYMPTARYALTAWGEQIHVAPTWDRGEPWISTVRHTAKEGRCFVVSACQAFHRDDVPEDLDFKSDYLQDIEGWINPGLSLIADPDGKIVAGPLEEKEGILYADVNQDQLVGPRWQLDTAGHYARPDVFELRVRRDQRPIISTYTDGETGDIVEPH
ncbi:MAG: nitrilase [Bacteroidetes bacterium CG12_big_fil_rev_8_21_14_0_65_60_17]|nr:MAG: nitrilase [Bacteroidetes bacterium CG12_big_fil_rev_8_21_14_0_65_60_17]